MGDKIVQTKKFEVESSRDDVFTLRSTINDKRIFEWAAAGTPGPLGDSLGDGVFEIEITIRQK